MSLVRPCHNYNLNVKNMNNLRRISLYSLTKWYSTLPKIQEQSPALQSYKATEGSIKKFPVEKLFTLKQLFEAGVHYGHKMGSLDERMIPYVYGQRLTHTIFNLDKTAEHLKLALNVTANIAYHDGIILFFMHDSKNSHYVEKVAKECGEFAHTRFWRGGIFTNANIQFGAVTRLPDLCIFLSTMNMVNVQHTAVRDSAKMLIPTIGIVDSNCNPNLITYPVPGNDDTPSAIKLYCQLLRNAILMGKERRKQDKL